MKVGQRSAQDLCYDQGYYNPSGSHPVRWVRTICTDARTTMHVLRAMDEALFVTLPASLRVIAALPPWLQPHQPSLDVL